MNKTYFLVIFILSLTFCLNPIKSMEAIFSFDEDEENLTINESDSSFNLSEFNEILNEITTKQSVPAKKTNAIAINTSHKKKHTRSLSDVDVKSYELPSFLQIICTNLEIDYKNPEEIFSLLNEKKKKIITQVCSPSEAFSELKNLEVFKKDILKYLNLLIKQ